jgi:hypothetical protein
MHRKKTTEWQKRQDEMADISIPDLTKAIQNYNCGNTQLIHKTLAELEEMET